MSPTYVYVDVLLLLNIKIILNVLILQKWNTD